MSILREEVKLWNTPLLGAFTTWEFAKGYTNSHHKSEHPTIFHCFLAQAILTSNQLSEKIHGKRTGFYSFARSLSEPGTMDLKYSIQPRVIAKTDYTLTSIEIALSVGLLKWNHENLAIIPNISSIRNKPPSFFQKHSTKAGLLGKWFSEITLKSISAALEVSF